MMMMMMMMMMIFKMIVHDVCISKQIGVWARISAMEGRRLRPRDMFPRSIKPFQGKE